MKRNRGLSIEVGRALAVRRNELGKTQSQVAKELRIQRTSLSNIESGKQVLLLDVFYELCIELDVKPIVILANAIHSLDGPIRPLDEIDRLIAIGQNGK